MQDVHAAAAYANSLHIFPFSQQSSSQSSEPGSTSPLLKKPREKLTVEGKNGETLHSFEASSEAAAAATGIAREVGRNPPQELDQPWRIRAHTSPEQLQRFRVNRQPGQHVHFSELRGNP